MGKYDDIINLPHHVSDYHKPMPMENRAAQFAPFAALSGHDDAIAETARVTDPYRELTQEEKIDISKKIRFALENKSIVEISYFVPDKTKSGGSYAIARGLIKKWDEFENIILLNKDEIINVCFISEIKNPDYPFVD